MSEINDKVREAVKDELKKHEVSEQLEMVEEKLELAETSINELTDVLTAKDGEIAKLTEEKEELQKKMEELDLKVKELEAKVADSDKRHSEYEQRAVAAETALADISKDRALEVRMRELEEAKVAKKGDKLAAQREKVREMSSEDFSAYRDELIEIRAQVEEAFKVEAAAGKDNEEVKNDEVVVPPADLSAAGKEAAALNVEGTATVSLKEKFRMMGDALAKKVKDEVTKELGK